MYGGCHHRGNYVFAIVVVDRLILSPYNTMTPIWFFFSLLFSPSVKLLAFLAPSMSDQRLCKPSVASGLVGPYSLPIIYNERYNSRTMCCVVGLPPANFPLFFLLLYTHLSAGQINPLFFFFSHSTPPPIPNQKIPNPTAHSSTVTPSYTTPFTTNTTKSLPYTTSKLIPWFYQPLFDFEFFRKGKHPDLDCAF